MKTLLILSAVLLLTVPGYAVTVENWPDATQPLPVTLTDTDSPDIYPAVLAGMGCAFTVCGFGWILRFAKRIGRYSE